MCVICEFDCVVCGQHVRKRRSPANILAPPRFCSQRCHGLSKRGTGNGTRPNHRIVCEHCGVEADVYRATSAQPPRFCSLACLGKAQRGENNPSYNGGRHKTANGYIVILAPDDPEADSRGYVYEHRLIAREIVGRLLLSTEVVHHIDMDKANNSKENFRVFESQSAHLKHHRELEQING